MHTMARILLAVAIALTAGAHAAEPGDGAIEEQILLAARDLGAAAPQSMITGKTLGLQDESRLPFEVEAGKSYVVAGACDEDCGELSLAAEDPDGAVIDASDENTDTPSLIFRPTASGKVSIHVIMEDCADDACSYGVGFFVLK